MSGSSKEFSAEDLAETNRISALNREVAKRIAAQGKAAVPVDAETLAAEKEDRERRAKIPAAMRKAPTSAIVVKSPSQLRAEADARIAAARAAIVVRPVHGEKANATEAEKAAKPGHIFAAAGKPPKAPKPEKGSKPAKASTPEIRPATVNAAPPVVTFGDYSSHVADWKFREAAIAAYVVGAANALLDGDDNLVTYTYDLPGQSIVSTGRCKRGEFAPIAVRICREGSRKVTPSEGMIVTLIHRREERCPLTGRIRMAEYAVGRKLVKDSDKGHATGRKAMAEGLPRSKSCPDCKGMGRRYSYTSGNVVCETCVKACGEKCPGASCKRCRGEGRYGAGNVQGAPLAVHAYTVTRDVLRTMPVGTDSNGETIDRGVLALDRPLSDQPVVPSRKSGALTTGGKPQSGAWQSRAKTTRVTFSGG